jgi:hypothetical protein
MLRWLATRAKSSSPLNSHTCSSHHSSRVMERRTNWQRALDDFLRTHQNRSFEYGRWDCCLFVCDAIAEMTGIDLAAPYRGKYSTRAGAFRAIREQLGTASIHAVAENAAAVHSLPEIQVSHARRGDMVLIGRGRDHSLGLVALSGADVIVTSKRGLWRLPLSRAVRAWHV